MSNQYNDKQVATLVKENKPRLKSFIRQRVKSDEDAEDILQDVFYQLVKTVGLAQDPIEHVSAWLYRVAKNLIINKGKKMHEDEMPTEEYSEDGDLLKDFSEILFNDDNPTPETEYLRSLVWEEIDKALTELPEEQRDAFTLTELEGLSVKDVALSMDVSVNTLLSRKHYAVLHLRERLSVLYEEILEA